MSATVKSNKLTPSADSAVDDLVWGLKAIGAEIGRTEAQAQYLHARGLLAGIVVKLGGKTVVASRAKLRKLTDVIAAKSS